MYWWRTLRNFGLTNSTLLVKFQRQESFHHNLQIGSFVSGLSSFICFKNHRIIILFRNISQPIFSEIHLFYIVSNSNPKLFKICFCCPLCMDSFGLFYILDRAAMSQWGESQEAKLYEAGFLFEEPDAPVRDAAVALSFLNKNVGELKLSVGNKQLEKYITEFHNGFFFYFWGWSLFWRSFWLQVLVSSGYAMDWFGRPRTKTRMGKRWTKLTEFQTSCVFASWVYFLKCYDWFRTHSLVKGPKKERTLKTHQRESAKSRQQRRILVRIKRQALEWQWQIGRNTGTGHRRWASPAAERYLSLDKKYAFQAKCSQIFTLRRPQFRKFFNTSELRSSAHRYWTPSWNMPGNSA